MITECWKKVMTGMLHEDRKSVCQDAAEYRMESGITVAVLSDGAGSCAFSDQAAETVCQWLADYMTTHFDELYNRPEMEIAEQLSVEIADTLRQKLVCTPDECLCTLVLFTLDENGRWLCGHVGDGVILTRENADIRALSLPENGFYRNETFFINEEQSVVRDHFRIKKGQTDAARFSVLMSSDGCSDDLCHPVTGEIYRAAAELIKAADDLAPDGFQAFLDEYTARLRQKCYDDISLILIKGVVE